MLVAGPGLTGCAAVRQQLGAAVVPPHTEMQLGAGASARFSRDDEREADGYGVKYLIGAAYAPNGLLSFFQKMKQMERGQKSKLGKLLASHPPTEERIQRIEKMIRRAGNPEGKTEAVRFMNRTAALRR